MKERKKLQDVFPFSGAVSTEKYNCNIQEPSISCPGYLGENTCNAERLRNWTNVLCHEKKKITERKVGVFGMSRQL